MSLPLQMARWMLKRLCSKYDRESNTRIWEGIPKVIVTAVMIAFSVYCLYMTLFSLEQAETRLARFVAMVIIVGYLMYPSRKTGHRVNHMPWYDIILMVAGAEHFCTTPSTRLTF